jgi:hypothetical protein
MAATNKFAIDITANDKTTQIARRIAASLSKMTAPITSIKKVAKTFDRELGIKNIAKDFGSATRGAMSFADKLAGIGSSLTGIAEIGGLASIAGVAALGRRWADTGAQIGRTANIIGISAQRLQSLRGAAGLSGLSEDDMTSDIKTLGKTLEDAAYGRNTTAMAMLQRQRIQLRRDAKGNIDTADALAQISDRIYKLKGRPQAQGALADIFGVQDILPLLQKGPKAIAGLEEEFRKSGAMMGPKAIKQATDFTAALNRLKYSIDGVGNSLARNMMPRVTELTNELSSYITKHREGIGATISHAMAGILGIPNGLPPAAEKQKQHKRAALTGIPSAAGQPNRNASMVARAAAGKAASSFKTTVANIVSPATRAISNLDLIQMLERSGENSISPAGAIGKYQVMPGTAAWMRKKYGMANGSLFDPAYNKLMASTYLGYLSKLFHNDLDAMVIGYNAGPGAAKRYLNAGRDPSVLPGETQRYLGRSHFLESILGAGRLQTAQEPQKVDLDVRFHGLPAGVTATVTQRDQKSVKVRTMSVATAAL